MERDRIGGLYEAGTSIRVIARLTSRSTYTVHRVVNSETPSQYTRRGPPPLLSEHDVRHLLRAAACGNSSAAQLKAELALPVSVRTVQRILGQVGWLVYTKMVNTLPLDAENKLTREAWAKSMLVRKDAGSVWDTIIFSDEKKWNLDGPDGFQTYWHDLCQPARQAKRWQAVSGSVRVWGTFSARGKSQLAVLVGRQVYDYYVYTVSEYLLPFAHQIYGTDFIYQQDNASIHVSKRTKVFFDGNDIDVLAWPSKSPDLNPIENLWSIMSRDVYANGIQFDSVSDLKTALQRAWSAILLDTLLTLVHSMPRRCVEVIEKNGDKTHY